MMIHRESADTLGHADTKGAGGPEEGGARLVPGSGRSKGLDVGGEGGGMGGNADLGSGGGRGNGALDGREPSGGRRNKGEPAT